MNKEYSIWKEDCRLPQRPRLTASIKREVIVIGGGMAGILTAYFLRKQGIEVAVLEAERIGSGQTGNTTAKITCQHGNIYSWLLSKWGEDAVKEYGAKNQKAIEDYETIIREEKISCDFERLPAYLYTRKEEEALKQEGKAARLAGIPCAMEHDIELPFKVSAALRFDRQAQFHPLKFLRAVSEKVEVYEHTPVLEVKGQHLITPEGHAEGGILVFATHYPFVNRPGYYFTKLHQERSYILALQNAQLPRGMYYGIDSDWTWSLRKAGDFILLGGGAHRTGIVPKNNPYDDLQKKAKEFWPQAEEAARWSAQDCITADGIPYIGLFSRRMPSWYIATGFHKWGMTHSMVSARLICQQILGAGAKGIFDPGRFYPRLALPAMLTGSAISIKNLIKAWTGNEPRCPHLGCRLYWNGFEKTWECQCHGSRFSQEGELRDNPAQTGLTSRGRVK